MTNKNTYSFFLPFLPTSPPPKRKTISSPSVFLYPITTTSEHAIERKKKTIKTLKKQYYEKESFIGFSIHIFFTSKQQQCNIINFKSGSEKRSWKSKIQEKGQREQIYVNKLKLARKLFMQSRLFFSTHTKKLMVCNM